MYCFLVFFLMIRRPPRSTRTDTLFPYTTLFRSCACQQSLTLANISLRASWGVIMPTPQHNRGWGHRSVQAGRSYRSEEHTSELQSLMRISYVVFCLKKKNTTLNIT